MDCKVHAVGRLNTYVGFTMKPVQSPLANVLANMHKQADSNNKQRIENILIELKKSILKDIKEKS